MRRIPPVAAGVLAVAGMGVFYAAVLYILGGGWDFVVWQTGKTAGWLAGVLLSFGLQVYWAVKVRQKGMAMIGGTGSGAVMIACCAHHVSDLLPLAGLAAGAGLVIRYQIPLMAGAIIINLLGTGYLINQYRRQTHLLI